MALLRDELKGMRVYMKICEVMNNSKYTFLSLFAVSSYVGNKENLSFFHHCLRFFPFPFSPSSYSFMVFVLAFKNLDLSMCL